MKKDTHPNYGSVIFKDTGGNFSFLGQSSLVSKNKETWKDGKEYPVFAMDISSASHPFYTGSDKIVDSEGRVERFHRKFKLRSKIRTQ